MSTTEVAGGTAPDYSEPILSQFHLLANSIPEPCFMANGDGHIIWQNARWCEYTGTTPEQVNGCWWEAMQDPELLPSVLARWNACLATGEPFEMEIPLRPADGHFPSFLARITPVRDGEQKVVRWFGCFTNIHELRNTRQPRPEVRNELERRKNERAAQQEQIIDELLRKRPLLDMVNDAIVVRNAQSRISYWNKGAERLYGWTSEEAVGRVPQELLQTEFPEPLEKIVTQDVWEGELRHTRKDGAQIEVESRWTRLRNEDGTTTGWLHVNSDISARKRAERSARKLASQILTAQDEDRRRIARNLHDGLGQYLTALKINLALLRSNDGRQAQLLLQCSELADKCLAETRTISHLLHPPLLDEAGLKSALQWCAAGFALRSGILVNLDLPADLNRFHKDVETALFRIAQEALTNVYRHSHASDVSIRLRVDAENVRLEIDDNGTGIPSEHLWGEFHGGVGLAGMRERIEDLRGSFEIDSDQSGTLLRIEIPIVQPRPESNKEHNAAITGIM